MDDDAMRQAIAELRAEVQLLRARVDSLSAALERVRAGREGTLKQDLRCTACGGRRVLHAEQIVDRGDSTSHRLALATVGFWSPKPRGEFECYVCIGCGFVEWYVKAPEQVEPDEATLSILEADPAGPGPYR